MSVFFGNADKDGEERADGLDLLSLDPHLLAKAEGVVVEEIQIKANIDEGNVWTLKYGVPDIKEFDIGEYLVYNELRLIAEELGSVDSPCWMQRRIDTVLLLERGEKIWTRKDCSQS